MEQPHVSCSMALLMLFLAAFPAITASAQSMMIGNDFDKGLAVEAALGQYKNSYINFFTGIYVLSGRFPLSGSLHLMVDLPLGYASYEVYTYWIVPPYGSGYYEKTMSEGLLGNPLVGLAIKTSESGLTFEVASRLPLRQKSKDDIAMLASFSDLDQFDALEYKYLPIILLIQHRGTEGNGFFHAFRAGGTLLMPVGDRKGDSDLYLRLNGKVGYEEERFRAAGGLNLMLKATDEHLSGSDRLIANLELGLTVKFSTVHPGLYFRIPLDKNMKDYVSSILGITLDFALN